MIGDIMRISRLRMGTDGKGVTTLVAFFDCPLHCKYCLNDFCHKYGVNESVPRAAYAPEELVKLVSVDDIYFKMSGGGITFGGGEPLLQSAFIHEVCKIADPSWKMRVETCLNVPWRLVETVVDDIDEWIIDIKETNRYRYRNYTGVEIFDMLENLGRLKGRINKNKFHIRIPNIPGYNTPDMVKQSVDEITDFLGVEPEVFDYIMVPQIRDKQIAKVPKVPEWIAKHNM